jgi:hypothetical protein
MENIERIKQLLLTLSESELQEIETFLQEHIHKKNQGKGESSSKRRVVQTLRGLTPDGQPALWQLEYVRCGKASCRKCNDGEGHGPYWYYYWRTSDQAKLKSRYWGKKEPPV